MADGDELLDNNGDVTLDDNGDVMLDDGVGCVVCCSPSDDAACWYPLVKCSDGTDSPYWLKMLDGGPECPAMSLDRVFQRVDDGTCHRYVAGTPGTAIPQTEIGAFDEIFSCDDCGVDTTGCFGGDCAGCKIKSIVYDVQGTAINPICCESSFSGLPDPQPQHDHITDAGVANRVFTLLPYKYGGDAHSCTFKTIVSVGSWLTRLDDSSVGGGAGVFGCTGGATEVSPSRDNRILIGLAPGAIPGLNFKRVEGTVDTIWGSFTVGAGLQIGGTATASCRHAVSSPNGDAEADCTTGFIADGGTTTVTINADCPEEPPP